MASAPKRLVENEHEHDIRSASHIEDEEDEAVSATCTNSPVSQEHCSIRCGCLMHIVPSTLCLQLIPQVPHVPTPEVKRQLLSHLVIDLDSVLIQLSPEIIPDGYLLLCDAATGMFNGESAWLLLSSPSGLK